MSIFQVLNNEDFTGGVILLLTDTQDSCHSDIEGGITNEELLQQVAYQNVQIIIIAFGY